MTENTSFQPLTITLSREELLAVLAVLRATTIPGLEREPSGELTPEQEAFALVVARRALLARELAQLRADGEFLLHRAVLTAVGVCAYAQDSILVYHWPAGAQAPAQLFGHARGTDAVVHTCPQPVLHRFTLLASRDELVEQVLTFCEFRETQPAANLDFIVPRQAFADARSLATRGDAPAAQALLMQDGVSEPAAAALVTTLTAAPRVSVLQVLTQANDQTVRTREFTLIQDQKTAWWMAPMFAGEAKAPVRVKTITGNEMRVALAAPQAN